MTVSRDRQRLSISMRFSSSNILICLYVGTSPLTNQTDDKQHDRKTDKLLRVVCVTQQCISGWLADQSVGQSVRLVSRMLVRGEDSHHPIHHDLEEFSEVIDDNTGYIALHLDTFKWLTDRVGLVWRAKGA